MRSVNVAELQNDLSAYLTCAQAGEEVIIHDHDRPLVRLTLVPVQKPQREVSPEIAAMLTPFDPEVDATAEERAQAAAGIIRLPSHKLDWETFNKLPLPNCTGDAVQALLDDREDRF